MNTRSSTTTNNNSTTTGSCPYAAALHWNTTTTTTIKDEDVTDDDTTSVPGSTSIGSLSTSTSPVLTSVTITTKELVQSCPVFQNGKKCPFASCTNDEEIRKMLLSIPPSHYSIPEHDESKKATGMTTTMISNTTTKDQSSSSSTSSTTTTTTPFLQVLQELHSSVVVTAGAEDSNNNNNNNDDTTAIAPTTAATTETMETKNALPFSTTVGVGIPRKCPIFSLSTSSSAPGATITTTAASDTTTVLNTTKSTISRTTSGMDGYSLAEIMAQLVKEFDDAQEKVHEQEEERTNIHQKRIVSTTDNDDDTTTTSSNTTKNDETTAMVASTAASDTQDDATTTTTTTPTADEIDATAVMSEQLLLLQQKGNIKKERSYSISATMKKGTESSHEAAENVYFVKNFIRGQIDPKLFALLTCQLYYIYTVLEHYLLLRMNDDETNKNGSNTKNNNVYLQQFYTFHDRLQRKQSLLDDLDYWFGPTITKQIVDFGASLLLLAATTTTNTTGTTLPTSNPYFLSTTRDYIERIIYCGTHNPLLLLAHSYTRYLGDLSGGKILARVARKALNLSNMDGLAFYDFSQTIPNGKQFKDQYRMALDQLSDHETNTTTSTTTATPTTTISEHDIHLLVVEANIAFGLNMRVFEELDVLANIPNAIVRPLSDVIVTTTSAVQQVGIGNDDTQISSTNTNSEQTQEKEIPKECPFAKLGKLATLNLDHHHHHHHANGSESATITTSVQPIDETPTTITSQQEVGNKKHKRCPWPFILFHDPKMALYDYQTWIVFGFFLCYLYQKFIIISSSSS